MNEKNKIEPGQIKFLEAAPPPMVAGKYKIVANHKVANNSSSNEDTKFAETFSFDKEFNVTAPRFHLDPADIYNVYPLANSYGTYSKSLPHIVFNRKTLPWERTIDFSGAGASKVKPPWLTLLLFDEDELENHNLIVKKASILDLLQYENAQENPIENIYRPLPRKQLSSWENEQAKKEEESRSSNNQKTPKNDAEKESGDAYEKIEYDIIDMPLGLFYKIAPKYEELPYLAHARQVDTGNKEMAGINAKGWFSVLVGNRLPAQDKRNTVFLVSLEGYKNILDKKVPTEDKKIRLIVFSQWSFTAKGVDFEELVGRINNGHSAYGTKVKGASLFRIDKEDVTLDEEIKKAFKFGYVPMNHEMRQGSKTVSWYRGPLVPAAIPKPEIYVYESADAALRFDKNTGMLDTSYAAAWQLGRLLALQDAEFSKLINNWKGNYKKDLLLRIARDLLKSNTLDFSEDADTLSANGKINFEVALAKIESDEFLKNIVMEWWNKSMA